MKTDAEVTVNPEETAANLREKAAEAARLSDVYQGEEAYVRTEQANLPNASKSHPSKSAAGGTTRGRLDRQADEQLVKDSPTLKIENPLTPRQPAAEHIVSLYQKLSAVSGFIPVPFVDMVVLSALQVRMILKLAELYGQSFSEQWVNTTVSTLLGTLTPTYLKAIPGIGAVIGLLTGPAFNFAATHAVGKVFIQHFEAGGTMLTFDPAQMKRYFADYFSAAKN
jgi:uncharacterized protein (DUF697 family)